MSSNCRINHRCIIFKIEIKENFERFYHGSVNIDGHGSNRRKGPAISFVNLTGEDTRGRVVGIPRPRRLPLANLHHNGKSRGKGWRDTWSFRERGLAPTRTRTYISTLDTRAERVVPRLSLSLLFATNSNVHGWHTFCSASNRDLCTSLRPSWKDLSTSPAFSTRPRDKREVKIRSIRGYIPSISFVTPDWLAANRSIRRDSASVFLGQVNFHVRSGQRFLHRSRLDIGQRGLVFQRNHEEVDSRRPVKPIEPWTRISWRTIILTQLLLLCRCYSREV